MKNNLVRTLSDLGLHRSGGALDRIDTLTDSIRSGRLPQDLDRKVVGFFPDSNVRAFVPHPRLEVLVKSITSHHDGQRRFGRVESLALVSYAVSYFWEDQDQHPDRYVAGLADDWTVIDRVYGALKRELDDYRLWSRRAFIQNEWERDVVGGPTKPFIGIAPGSRSFNKVF
jgi:hypothetical protein